MTKREFFKLPIGLYIIYWNDCVWPSIGSIGVTVDGGRWIAPDNWVLPVTDKKWRKDGSHIKFWLNIKNAVLILKRVKVYNEDGTSTYLLKTPEKS